MAKRARITGPGYVHNRNPKKGEVQVAFDPSPDGFVTQARLEKQRMKVTIAATDDEMDPIELSVQPRLWLMTLSNVAMDKSRLADLEYLLTEERPVHITIEFAPDAKLFDGDSKPE